MNLQAYETKQNTILPRIAAGDETAVQECIDAYGNLVWALSKKYTTTASDAEDAVQEALVAALSNRESFQGQSALRTWIYRIVTNVTIDWLRKKQVKGSGTEFDDAVQLKEIDPASRTVPKADALPHERMERKEIRARIDAAIQQLSPEHRAVILMKETEDMQYHEIAEALGCSIGTVMSRLFYARKKLQNLLRDLYENV